MFVAAKQHDAPARFRAVRLSEHWTVRLVLCAVAFAVSAVATVDNLYAGCHYGDGRSFTGSIADDNPHGHARNFTFLGQWIYEAGEIKYVPWQGAPPCQGPNCHADDPRPVTTGSPSQTVKRISPVTLTLPWQGAHRFDALDSCIASSNLFPISGYPHEYEYPP